MSYITTSYLSLLLFLASCFIFRLSILRSLADKPAMLICATAGVVTGGGVSGWDFWIGAGCVDLEEAGSFIASDDTSTSSSKSTIWMNVMVSWTYRAYIRLYDDYNYHPWTGFQGPASPLNSCVVEPVFLAVSYRKNLYRTPYQRIQGGVCHEQGQMTSQK